MAVYPSPKEQKRPLPRPHLREGGVLREIVDLVVLIGAIYALVNLLTVRFVVDGPSMEPNFETGQFLIVSRLHYILGDPQRGDIAVFHFPGNPDDDYIKRVIGIPGDQVEIRDTLVYVNGVQLNETYINEPCLPSRCENETWVLGEGEYFFMGDNRNRSSDSRSFGVVNREYIVGEVLLRYWPLSDFALVNSIGYPD